MRFQEKQLSEKMIARQFLLSYRKDCLLAIEDLLIQVADKALKDHGQCTRAAAVGVSGPSYI